MGPYCGVRSPRVEKTTCVREHTLTLPRFVRKIIMNPLISCGRIYKVEFETIIQDQTFRQNEFAHLTRQLPKPSTLKPCLASSIAKERQFQSHCQGTQSSWPVKSFAASTAWRRKFSPGGRRNENKLVADGGGHWCGQSKGGRDESIPMAAELRFP